jgi:AhpD family alkylhydroperoxidase
MSIRFKEEATSMHDEIARHRSAIVAGLLILGAIQLGEGLWQLLGPANWFHNFPYPEANWSALFGDYSEHDVRDLGAAMTAIGFLLIVAAVSMRRVLVQAALATYVVLQLPHALFHFANDHRLSATGQALNGLAVALSVIVPLAMLALSCRPAAGPLPRDEARPGPAAGSPNSADGRGARIAPARRGLLLRAADRWTRRSYGRTLTPVALYAHSPGLLLAYGAFEAAFERTSRVDRRLKTLAELRSATLVRCEWCMDFGSAVARHRGIEEHQLRELPRYRESDAFTPTEKLVLDYATAITRTPGTVEDALVERLRGEFSDAQILELTVAAAIENYRARVNSALGVEPEGLSEGAFCVLPVDVDAAGEPAASTSSAG